MISRLLKNVKRSIDVCQVSMCVLYCMLVPFFNSCAILVTMKHLQEIKCHLSEKNTRVLLLINSFKCVCGVFFFLEVV